MSARELGRCSDEVDAGDQFVDHGEHDRGGQAVAFEDAQPRIAVDGDDADVLRVVRLLRDSVKETGDLGRSVDRPADGPHFAAAVADHGDVRIKRRDQ